MLRILPFLIVLGVVIFALVDCAQTPEREVKYLPKAVWIILIIVFSLFGALAWLIVGHDRSGGVGPGRWAPGGGSPESRRPRPMAPDDDPDFLRGLGAPKTGDAEMMRQWEEDLRRREDELPKPEDEDPRP